jgi:hypothetical protein
MLRLIEFLEKNGYTNIIILDNDSTYPPLLEYYKRCVYRIVYLKENLGHTALNKCSLYNEVKKDFFVYTDPDVLPVDECPDDFLKHFLDIMKKDLRLQKIGFSLKIDDLPDCYEKKQDVIRWEPTIHKKEVMPNVFRAGIDTTFALHRPWVKTAYLSCNIKHYRVGYPYQARHLPWYENSKNPDEENVYYKDHARPDINNY